MPPTKRKATSKKSISKSKPKRRKVAKSRLRTNPISRPNTYRFTREYSHPFAIGSVYPDNANGGYMNTDSRYMIIKCATNFHKLPDSAEFMPLFSEYKIDNFVVTFTPYYKNNVPAVYDTGIESQAVPNYEIFSIPVNYAEDSPKLELKTGDEIDKWLGQTQRFSRKMMPNGILRFPVPKPQVVRYTGPLNKEHGTSVSSMGAPTYLSTDPTKLPADQTKVLHYGNQLVIRRVDGAPIVAQPQTMGGRLSVRVNFHCRKVQ